MNREEAILISDDSDEEYVDRRSILEPAIRGIVDALGGLEGGAYRLGDECYGCLKDLKKLWRRDDTDDDRTVARIFWETRLLPNDLIPILLETAGKGQFEDKCAIACADLMTAMTWPIDLAEELKELDEEYDKGADYTQLLLSHLHYKAALLKPGVMQALLGVALPCLTKNPKERKERDIQIINVILYLIRNLAFIKVLPPNMHLSADQAEFSSLQTRLVKTLSESNVLDLLLTIASSVTEDPMFNGWNTLLLEIFYLLFRGTTPVALAMDQSQNLQRLLAVEGQRRRDFARKANSRHSRFGTTISVQLNPKKAQVSPPGEEHPDVGSSSQAYVLHRQQAINSESGSMFDMEKRRRAQRSKKVDELARDDNLSLEAKLIMQNLARTFVEACFNPFLSSLLKDIRAERPKITEKDNLRLLCVAKWFLEFFLCVRAKKDQETPWDFGLVAEVTERHWIIWVLKRMQAAVEEKPKLWNELQAGVECLTQLLFLLDAMSSSSDATTVDVAETLQQQIVYNGTVLDVAFESLPAYREGTQSLAYLDASVQLAYALMRMLERWEKKHGTAGEMYVRRKAKARRKSKDLSAAENDAEGVLEVEEEDTHEEDEDDTDSMLFSVEKFQQKFSRSDITQTLLMYLARYKEFDSAEKMKRVVYLMHRQAVKGKAEGLFFNVSTLNLFKSILSAEKSLPRDQAYEDLIALINFLLRRFFKAVEDDSFLIVETFFPKNRGHWKQYSSWEPDKSFQDVRTVQSGKFPPDVKVKKGYSWSHQLGIAIACLVEEGTSELIEWVKQILVMAIGQRQRIIEETDGSMTRHRSKDEEDGSADESKLSNTVRKPSDEALAKFTDYMIPYVSDDEANAATKNPYLKLLFDLVNFRTKDRDAEELEWYIPAKILPSNLQQSLNVINQFLEKPLELEGKATQLLSTKRRRSSFLDSSKDYSDDDAVKKIARKKAKKKKEKQQYKSAQFIEDSDAEYGDTEMFFERERGLRERAARVAAESGQVAMMMPMGAKRRKKASDANKSKRRRKSAKAGEQGGDIESDDSDIKLFDSPRASSSDESVQQKIVTQSRPRPRPRPRYKAPPAEDDVDAPLVSQIDGHSESTPNSPPRTSSLIEVSGAEEDDLLSVKPAGRKKGRLQLALSDDDE
ncbi:timeless-domain-containing protein [Wolfiporia cocos MD-104 SS10]|uniref:Timeless-domain-containing protein n=1 Tax=Wolfiporia cocos (strain MD-104) TaxID=742152 RepID=A0A2H3JAL4_WOLCO|nr:timeless-domain-containing protein [Wolfiporia cocos MD-104 SS10]